MAEQYEDEQVQAAGAEAGAIGGRAAPVSDKVDGEQADPAQVPLAEAGQGEGDGFEQAEQELIDNASHGDQHAARQVLEDAPPEEDAASSPGAEADRERSSERPDQD